MKNKKGFTLIELLAVIVILAIIALIAVPIILNMIENAKKSAAIDSTYGYIEAVENYQAYEMLKGNDGLKEGIYEITEDKTVDNVKYPKLKGLIKLKGNAPTFGNVGITKNGTVGTANLCVNNYLVAYQNKKAEILPGGCENLGITLTFNISSEKWETSKTLEILYPEGKYEYYYKLESGKAKVGEKELVIGEEIKVETNTINIELLENSKITAWMVKNGEKISPRTYEETKIDITNPELELGNIIKTTNTITIPIKINQDKQSDIMEIICKYGKDENNLDLYGTIKDNKCIISSLASLTTYFYSITTTNNARLSTTINGNVTTEDKNSYIVVATNGSDETGDGTEEKPFASVQKAIYEVANGGKIFVKAGTYNLVSMPGQSNTSISAGIMDYVYSTKTYKEINIYGENEKTILIYDNSDKTVNYRDGSAIHLAKANSSIRNLVYIYKPTRGTNYANSIFSFTKGTVENVFFIIDNTSKKASYEYYNDGTNTHTVKNSTFFHTGEGILSNYSGSGIYTNIATNVKPPKGTLTNVVLSSFATSSMTTEEIIEASKSNESFISAQAGVFYGENAWK